MIRTSQSDAGHNVFHHPSGGSLLISAQSIQGNGTLAARGGNASSGGGGGGGRISLIFDQTPAVRARILSGQLDRATQVGELPNFLGSVSATNGMGFYNGAPQGAEPGTVYILQAQIPSGTIFVCF